MWGDDMTCENCKYYDVDYEWDDDYEEEIEVDVCRKGHEIDFVLKISAQILRNASQDDMLREIRNVINASFYQSVKKTDMYSTVLLKWIIDNILFPA